MSYSIREGSLAPLAKAERRPDEVWQADVFESPVLVKTGAGLVRPLVAMVVEPKSRYLLATLLAEPGETPAQALGDGLIEAMGRNGVIPGEIGTTAALAAELTALSQALGVAIIAASSMPELRDTRRIMTSHFKRRRPGRYPEPY